MRLLNEKQTAERMGIAVQTLRNWRGKFQGPPWIKIGKRLIRYPEAELEQFLRSRLIDPKKVMGDEGNKDG